MILFYYFSFHRVEQEHNQMGASPAGHLDFAKQSIKCNTFKK